MAVTLFDLVWKTLVELGVSRSGTATGGTTSTLIDTNGLKLVDNDYYNEGTVLILKTTDGGAPEKEFSVVSNFANQTSTVSLQDALSAVVGAGDTYGIANRRYPLYRVRQKINSILYLDGYIPGEDTSLLMVSGQTEYDLPVGASRDLRQVYLLSSNDDGDRKPIPVVNYRIQRTATGTQDKLILAYELPAGYYLWLRYAEQHAELRDADDELDPAIHPDRVVYPAAAELLREFRDRTRLRHLDSSISNMELKAETAKELHPLPALPPKQSRVGIVSRSLEIGTTYVRRG